MELVVMVLLEKDNVGNTGLPETGVLMLVSPGTITSEDCADDGTTGGTSPPRRV
jgi:hypothetical protein